MARRSPRIPGSRGPSASLPPAPRAVHAGPGAGAGAGGFAFDDLDRRIIACLRADGRASWTEIARRCSTSVATVSRRGQRLLTGQTVHVAVVPHRTHPGRNSLFFLRLSCRSGAQPRVVAELAAHPDIRFLALVTGPYDIAAEVCTDNSEPLIRQLVAEFQEIDGVEWCETDLILHEYKVVQDWTWPLLVGETGAGPVREPHTCSETDMDDLDQAIAGVLRADGRAAFSVVAGQVGLNETTVRRRFEAMVARGCLRVQTLTPASALGFTSEVLLDISVEPPKLGYVSERLTSFAGVRFVAATLRGSSLLCEMIQPSQDALFTFLTQTLASLDGVRGWEASMELLTIRRGFVETPWWRDELADHLGAGPGQPLP